MNRRKDIPQRVKLEVLVRQARCASCGEKLGTLTSTEFNHNPPLALRRWDETALDYDPPQLNPDYIEALHDDCHLFHTSGRKPGASKTVTTRGSVVGDLAHGRKVTKAQEEFRRRLLAKDRGEPPQRSRWPKRTFRRAA